MMKWTPRKYQQRAIDAVRRASLRGINRQVIVVATGGGKCHGVGTPILMHDGSIKKVEDVIVGDFLMGPDSLPREVLTLARGRGPLYKIKPIKGESWVCNDVHILSLKCTADHSRKYKKDQVINIPLDQYLKKDKTFKHMMKLWRTGVTFHSSKTEIDPYLLGVWLGDGSWESITIHNSDPEIIEYLEKESARMGLVFKKTFIRKNNTHRIRICRSHGKTNPLLDSLRKCRTDTGKKFIPLEYLTGSRENRLRLLAGLLDTCGYYHQGHYEIITKHNRLKDDILYLARSVGLAAYFSKKIGKIKSLNFIGEYWRVTISGELNHIPCKVKRKQAGPRLQKKNVLKTGFGVEPLGEGNYYGFELTGDKLYLLGDFTVTHNTPIMGFLYRELKHKKLLFLAHRTELLVQARKTFEAINPDVPTFIEQGKQKVSIAELNSLDHAVIFASVQTFRSAARLGRFDPNTFDAIQIDECVDGESIVITEKGPTKLKNAKDCKYVLSNDGTRDIFKRITFFWDKGKKEVFEITTDVGIIKCTANHLLKTQRGWVRADDLKQSDLIQTYGKTDFQAPLKMLPAILSMCMGMTNTRTTGTTACHPKSLVDLSAHSWGIARQDFHTVDPRMRDLQPIMGYPRKNGHYINAANFLLNSESPKKITPDGETGGSEQFQQHIPVSLKSITSSMEQVVRKSIEQFWTSLQKKVLRGGLQMTAAPLGPSMEENNIPGVTYRPMGFQNQRMNLLQNGLKQEDIQQQFSTIQEKICIQLDLIKKERINCGKISKNGYPNACSTKYVAIRNILKLKEKINVYDIEVEDTHCFYANGMLAHNCHHTPARTYLSILTYFGFSKNDFKPNRFLLGVTATPERTDKKTLDQVYDYVAYSKGTKSLIQDGFLCPMHCYRIFTESSLDGVAVKAGDLKQSDLEKAVNVEIRNRAIVGAYHKHLENKKTIVFCVTLKHMRAVEQKLLEDGIPREQVGVVHGDTKTMSSDERREVLQWFKETPNAILLNCMLLTEGYDEPTVDGIIIARPTLSPTLYKQMVGRALRLHDNKEFAIIVDVVDVTTKHNLETSASISGLPQHVNPAGDVFEQARQYKKLLLLINKLSKPKRIRQAKDATTVERLEALASEAILESMMSIQIDPFALAYVGVAGDIRRANRRHFGTVSRHRSPAAAPFKKVSVEAGCAIRKEQDYERLIHIDCGIYLKRHPKFYVFSFSYRTPGEPFQTVREFFPTKDKALSFVQESLINGSGERNFTDTHVTLLKEFVQSFRETQIEIDP